MGVERIVTVGITRREGAAGLASQNYPVILVDDIPTTGFSSSRINRYSVNDLATIGTQFGTSTAAYKAFRAMASQGRKPKYIYVAERDAAVATQMTLTKVGSILAGQTIEGIVNGTAISVPFDTDIAGTLADLDTAISAVEGVANVTVAGQVLTIVATAQWELSVSDFEATGAGTLPTFTIATTVAGRNISDDIADMFAENSTPYLIYMTSTSKGAILAAAAYVETLRKLLFAASTDSAVATAGSTDVASLLQAADYTRTALFYTEDSTQHYPAALASLCLSYAPGKVAFHNKELTGVTADTLTSSEVGIIEGKNANNYTTVYGDVALVLQGVTADGVQIHATRDQDYFQTTLEGRIANTLKVNPKIPLNTKGLAMIAGEGQGVMNQMVREDVFDSDVDATFVAPDIADISEEDVTAHLASGFTGGAKIQNAMVEVSINLDIQL
jgi:hypothetical protein